MVTQNNDYLNTLTNEIYPDIDTFDELIRRTVDGEYHIGTLNNGSEEAKFLVGCYNKRLRQLGIEWQARTAADL